MNLFDYFHEQVLIIINTLITEGVLPEDIDTSRIAVEPPRDQSHGDVTTNAALLLAKPARMKASEIAAPLVKRLKAIESVAGAEIAGPGFINLTLNTTIYNNVPKNTNMFAYNM